MTAKINCIVLRVNVLCCKHGSWEPSKGSSAVKVEKRI